MAGDVIEDGLSHGTSDRSTDLVSLTPCQKVAHDGIIDEIELEVSMPHGMVSCGIPLIRVAGNRGGVGHRSAFVGPAIIHFEGIDDCSHETVGQRRVLCNVDVAFGRGALHFKGAAFRAVESIEVNGDESICTQVTGELSAIASGDIDVAISSQSDATGKALAFITLSQGFR